VKRLRGDWRSHGRFHFIRDAEGVVFEG